MKALKVLGFIFLGILVFYGIVNLIPPHKVIEKNPFMKTDKTLISAHRGGANLNPENTEKAFDYVILETTYTDIVEIDIRTTKDGEFVIIHDETINRTGIKDEAVEAVKINDTDYKDLLNYNLGVNFVDSKGDKPYENYDLNQAKSSGLTIMTLEEFLIKYNNVRDFKLYLEIKEDKEIGINAVKEALKLLEKHSWWKDRTMIISFSTPVVEWVLENDKTQLVGALGYKIAPQLVCSLLKLDVFCKSKYHGFQTSMTNSLGPITVNCATKGMIKSAHKRNQSITYWTINEPEDMKKLISLGVDVITTNSPDVLAELL